MKLKWLLNNSQIIVSTLGVAALAAGCSSENTGGSYAQQTTVQKQIRSENVAVDKGNAQNVVIQGNLNQQNQAMGAATEPGGQATGAEAGPITDIATLTSASDASSLSGRQVQLNNVKIDQMNGQYLYVSDNSGKDACVRLQQADASLKPGDTVNITGTAAAMSTMGQSAEQMPQAASGQHVCIHATSVQKQ